MPQTSGNARTTDAQRSGCIVLIDDEETILDVMYSLLHDDEGYAVVPLQSGRAALAATMPAPPALILLDATLRGEDPATVVAALRERPQWRDAALVICSGAPGIHDLVRQVDADAVLPKPFDLDDLLALVRRFVQAPR